MVKKHWKLTAVTILFGAAFCVVVYAASTDDSEREVTKAEVPAAALATLEKMAAGANITEFAEEVEHGHTFYEGSWKTSAGTSMDVLVTPTGDLVEIEEQASANNVPAAVLKAAKRAAGNGVQLAFERKTTILYEAKFRKGNKQHELVLTPDGRHNEKEDEKGQNEKAEAGDDK